MAEEFYQHSQTLIAGANNALTSAQLPTFAKRHKQGSGALSAPRKLHISVAMILIITLQRCIDADSHNYVSKGYRSLGGVRTVFDLPDTRPNGEMK